MQRVMQMADHFLAMAVCLYFSMPNTCAFISVRQIMFRLNGDVRSWSCLAHVVSLVGYRKLAAPSSSPSSSPPTCLLVITSLALGLSCHATHAQSTNSRFNPGSPVLLSAPGFAYFPPSGLSLV